MAEPPSGPWASTDAVVVRHVPARLRLALAAVFVSLLSVWPPLLGLAPTWAAIASALAILGASLAAARAHAGRVETDRRGASADATGIFVGAERVIERDRVAYGFVEPAPVGARAKLFDASHGLQLEVRVKDLAEGRGLLRAMGLDVDQRVAPFFAASPVGGSRGFVIALSATVAVWWLLLQLAPGYGRSSSLLDDALTLLRASFPVLAMLGWAIASAIPTRVQVGADGVEVRWMRRRRFVPYRSIVRVVPAFGQLRVGLSDGRTLWLRGLRRSFTPQTRADHRAMVDRMGAAIEQHLALSRVQEAVAHLPPPREDGPGWLRELAAVDVGVEGGYRRAVVSRESLWRVVEDASMDERTRAGAAVALRRQLGEEERVRLRVVAGSTASPRLRVAIEAAAGEDDAALGASLGELVAGDAVAPRRRARG